MSQVPEQDFKVVANTKCETVADLLEALYHGASTDPRGQDVGEATAVQIGNKYIVYQLREFKDGTREVALLGE